MDIYLLRHGIAEDARPGISDSDRALTREGRDKLRRVLKRAQEAGDVRPDATFDDIFRMVIGMTMVAFIEDGQRERVLDMAFDGLRRQPSAS